MHPMLVAQQQKYVSIAICEIRSEMKHGDEFRLGVWGMLMAGLDDLAWGMRQCSPVDMTLYAEVFSLAVEYLGKSPDVMRFASLYNMVSRDMEFMEEEVMKRMTGESMRASLGRLTSINMNIDGRCFDPHERHLADCALARCRAMMKKIRYCCPNAV